MGELINLNPKGAITDADIPAAIARDSETTAALNAHTAAVDPHPIYLIQAEGDARYPQFKRRLYSFNAGSTVGSVSVLAHGLSVEAIQSFSAFLLVGVARILPGVGVPGFPGHSYSVALEGGIITCRLSADSSQVLNARLTVCIDYS